MAAARSRPDAPASVEARLLDGYYDRVMAEFQEQMDEATAALRRCYEAMRAENTLRS